MTNPSSSSAESVIGRGESIADMLERSAQLKKASEIFLEESIQVKRAMWWRNAKIWIIALLIVILVIIIITVSVCMTHKCIA